MTPELLLGYIFFLVLVFWFLFSIANYATHRRFRFLNRTVLLLVTIPRQRVERLPSGHTLSEIGLTNELIQRLGGRDIPFALEVAVHHTGEEIHFYISVPRSRRRVVEETFRSLFADVRITVSDYDLWLEGGETEIFSIKLTKPYLIPLKGASKPSYDPFLPIVRELSHLRSLGEGVAIQWVVRPISYSVKREMRQFLKTLATGRATSFRHIHEDFLVTGGTVEVLYDKIASPLYAVNGRVVVHAQTAGEVKEITRRLEGDLSRISGGMLYNSLELIRAKKQPRVLAAFSGRLFDQRDQLILSSQELALLFHYPTPENPVHHIKRH